MKGSWRQEGGGVKIVVSGRVAADVVLELPLALTLALRGRSTGVNVCLGRDIVSSLAVEVVARELSVDREVEKKFRKTLRK